MTTSFLDSYATTGRSAGGAVYTEPVEDTRVVDLIGIPKGMQLVQMHGAKVEKSFFKNPVCPPIDIMDLARSLIRRVPTDSAGSKQFLLVASRFKLSSFCDTLHVEGSAHLEKTRFVGTSIEVRICRIWKVVTLLDFYPHGGKKSMTDVERVGFGNVEPTTSPLAALLQGCENYKPSKADQGFSEKELAACAAAVLRGFVVSSSPRPKQLYTMMFHRSRISVSRGCFEDNFAETNIFGRYTTPAANAPNNLLKTLAFETAQTLQEMRVPDNYYESMRLAIAAAWFLDVKVKQPPASRKDPAAPLGTPAPPATPAKPPPATGKATGKAAPATGEDGDMEDDVEPDSANQIQYTIPSTYYLYRTLITKVQEIVHRTGYELATMRENPRWSEISGLLATAASHSIIKMHQLRHVTTFISKSFVSEHKDEVLEAIVQVQDIMRRAMPKAKRVDMDDDDSDGDDGYPRIIRPCFRS